MEIVKQNEQFNISDTTSEGWTVTGNFTKSIDNNNYSLNFNIQKDAESIGFVSYTNNSGEISINYNCSEVNRDKFTAYMDTVIDSVLTYKNV